MTPEGTTDAGGEGSAPDPRRWRALAAVASGQLIIAADFTIMNIALPSAQRTLHMSDPSRQWVMTMFALGYGGFLLLGGRVCELLGRRRSLLVGLAGFAAASALGGAATNAAMLLAARGLQGVFGALFTPAVLALIGTTFTTPAERARAFGIFGTVMGSSSGVGLLFGGLITDYLGWRYSLYVSVPIAIVAAVGILGSVPASRGAGAPASPAGGAGGRLDMVGAGLATVGLMGLVFGFSRAETYGWGTGVTLASLAAGVTLLTAFVVVEARVARPLLPLRVVAHRGRGGAYLAVLCLGIGVFAVFFFLTYYLQAVLGYSPAHAGLAFLPFTIAIMIGVRVVDRLITRAPIRVMLTPGLLSIAAGLAVLGLLRADSSYWSGALPVLALVGFGIGWVMIPANSIATLDAGRDAGVAGAAVMTSQQIGASLGLALLGTIAGTATADYLGSHGAGTAGVGGAAGVSTGTTGELVRVATVHGFNVASLAGAVFLAAGALAVYLVIGPRGAIATGHSRETEHLPTARPVPAPDTPADATATATTAVAATTAAAATAGDGPAGLGESGVTAGATP
ncbi:MULTISPECIES: MFS transporter [Protofrankia]|uniref:MFS transporter n=1 Tax=Protofrankia TaxID=2994361 RepID=UPI000978A457|nr:MULTISPECIES: MFS transporter [Protofrankia]ONH32517.1 MFS transporter [Protofrankia sp. BMG5.30]